MKAHNKPWVMSVKFLDDWALDERLFICDLHLERVQKFLLNTTKHSLVYKVKNVKEHK